MIDTPTLFILGAGASKPYGYPTGAELRKDIIDNCHNELKSLPGIKNTISGESALDRIDMFKNCFFKSSLKSIDKYLALNPDDSNIGKIAITQSILKSETKSLFREHMDSPDEDWYSYLYNRMTERFKEPNDYKQFFKNNVAFITFNYDRSLEYFLYDSFFHSFNQKQPNMRRDVIDELVPFPIIHVYGTIGSLSLSDWFDNCCDYKSKFNNRFNSIETRSKGIRVIGEDRAEEIIKEKIKELITGYKRIFFLGFSFAPENLDALDLPNSIDEKWQIFGTAKCMTEREIDKARNILNIKFPSHARSRIYSNPMLKDVDSCALLREHL